MWYLWSIWSREKKTEHLMRGKQTNRILLLFTATECSPVGSRHVRITGLKCRTESAHQTQEGNELR
jgi:hypothetical protein